MSHTNASWAGGCCALALALLPTNANAGEYQPRIAVLDFTANGAPPRLGTALSASVANELQRLGVFRVMTPQTVRDLLVMERTQQLLGCPDDKCVVDTTEALDMDFIVTGTVSAIKGSKDKPAVFTLELALIDRRQSRRAGSEVTRAQTEVELVEASGPAIIKLVRGLLAQRSGQLVITCSEAGATVTVDDEVVGTTPLPGSLSLAAGPHRVKLSREGFVTFQKDIRIEPGQAVEHAATLVPSAEFIEDYRSKHSKLRVGAWISSVVALGALGGAGYFEYRAQSLYGTPDRPGTFQFHKERLLAGIEEDEDGDHRQQTLQLRTSIDSSQQYSRIAAGVAGAALIGATVFWIVGDDPGHYDRFGSYEVSAAAALFPGGASASFTISF